MAQRGLTQALVLKELQERKDRLVLKELLAHKVLMVLTVLKV